MASSSTTFQLWFLTLLSSHLIPSSSSTTITLPLTHFAPTSAPTSNHHHFKTLVSTSLSRAKLLKTLSPQSTSTSVATPLFAHSYGAYSISLSFGSPAQTLPFIIQTSTAFSWLPCTHRYICKNCTSTSSPTSFIPKSSSSSSFLPCLNPKCGWFHDTDVSNRCQDCSPESFTNCTQVCPPYIISSGSGYTGGVILSETLDLTPDIHVPNFTIGCSVFSSKQPPAGVIGLGRGLASLPSQLGVSKFSYCLLSHKFDDSGKSSNLVLNLGHIKSSSKTENLSYIQFIKNPSFPTYFYLPLRRITVGGQRVRVPYKYLATSSDGSGGTIIDSGSAFSTMIGEVFDVISSEFVNQATAKYNRSSELESKTGLTPCFNVSGIENTLSFGELSFEFKGGSRMVLPVQNYFSFVGEGSETVCLTLLRDDESGEGGPAVILGTFQMQNIYSEFDLSNERFGFRPKNC